MSLFKFAANLTFLFNDMTVNYLDKYRLAAEFGFTYIESMFPPSNVSLEQLIEAQNKYKLKQILINTECDDNFGYAAVKGKDIQFKQSLEKTINYAKQLKIQNVHIMSGIINQSNESIENEAYEVLKNNLIYACTELKKYDMIALIEPINNYSIPNYYLNNYKTAINIINALNELNITNIKLQLDIFHMQMICGDLTNNIKQFQRQVGHIQIAQAPNRNEPNFDGEINYKYIFELLNKLEYVDYVGLEYKPTGNTVKSLNSYFDNFKQKL